VSEVLRETNPENHRRSTRVAQALPIIVHGVDAHGRKFKEHTFTVTINCHGCSFQSEHNLLKESKVTLQIPHPIPGIPDRMSRARIAWVKPPRSKDERWSIGAELEFTGNIWGIEFPPSDWFLYSELNSAAAPKPNTKSDSSASANTTSDAMNRAVRSIEQSLAASSKLVANDSKIAQLVHPPAPSSTPQRPLSDAAARFAELEESAANRINLLVEGASARLDQQSSALAATLRESLARSSADSEKAIGEVCTHLDSDVIQARALLAEVKSAAEELQETSNKFDALRRTATDELKWHEKSIENQVQMAMEKAANDAVRVLSEKAAEVTARFGAQLETFSQNFVEHTRSELEEASRNTGVQSRQNIQKIAEGAAASLRLEAQRAADSVMLLAGSPDSSAATESQVSAQDLAHSWTDGQDATIDDFKKRLEETSNAWLASTISILEERAQKSLDAMVKSFEVRLRTSRSL